MSRRVSSRYTPIYFDEIGIAMGVVGQCRLRTLFQPVYRAEGERLVPTALRSSSAAYLDDSPIDLAHLLALSSGDASELAQLGSALALANFRNAFADELDLYVPGTMGTLDPRQFAKLVKELARRADRFGLEPNRVICEIDGNVGAANMRTCAQALRQAGVRVAISNTRADDPVADWIAAAQPDLVRLQGDWFAALNRHPVSLGLVSSLVRSIRDEGASVLIDGIDNPALLRAALGTGAELLQGNYLQSPVLAGTAIDMDAIPMELNREFDNVVPMRRIGG